MIRWLWFWPGRGVAVIIVAAIVVAANLVALAEPAVTPLVSTDWVRSNLERGDLVIIDIRGEADFAKAHVPGSIRSDHPGIWRGKNGVVPPITQLEAGLTGLGVANGKTVVIVPAGKDATEFGAAARVYWTLKYLGHDAVAILDGGWKAWATDSALPVAGGEEVAKKASTPFVAKVQPELLATTDQVAAKLDTATVLVDARPEAQYLGKDKVAAATRFGHIPGAVSLDQARFYDAVTNRLKPKDALLSLLPDELRDKTDADVVSYCNTGWWSATNWFVLHELLGYDNAALYAKSMVGWTADPSRPVATGTTN